MPTLTPPGRKQKEVGGKFLVASALILTLEAHCLVGICVDPSEDFLLGRQVSKGSISFPEVK